MTVLTVSAQVSEAAKRGITFSREKLGTPVTIGSIEKNGFFSYSALVPGLVVLEVNGVKLTSKSPEEATDILYSSSNGRVSISAEGFIGKIFKDSIDDTLGIILKESPSSKGVFIAKIKQESKFSKTELKEGMKIVSIDGVPCPPSAIDAVKMMKEKIGRLEIIAINVACEKLIETMPKTKGEIPMKRSVDSNFVYVQKDTTRQTEVKEDNYHSSTQERKVDEIMRRLNKLETKLQVAAMNVSPTQPIDSGEKPLLGLELETHSVGNGTIPHFQARHFSLPQTPNAATNMKKKSGTVRSFSKKIGDRMDSFRKVAPANVLTDLSKEARNTISLSSPHSEEADVDDIVKNVSTARSEVEDPDELIHEQSGFSRTSIPAHSDVNKFVHGQAAFIQVVSAAQSSVADPDEFVDKGKECFNRKISTRSSSIAYVDESIGPYGLLRSQSTTRSSIADVDDFLYGQAGLIRSTSNALSSVADVDDLALTRTFSAAHSSACDLDQYNIEVDLDAYKDLYKRKKKGLYLSFLSSMKKTRHKERNLCSVNEDDRAVERISNSNPDSLTSDVGLEKVVDVDNDDDGSISLSTEIELDDIQTSMQEEVDDTSITTESQSDFVHDERKEDEENTFAEANVIKNSEASSTSARLGEFKTEQNSKSVVTALNKNEVFDEAELIKKVPKKVRSRKHMVFSGIKFRKNADEKTPQKVTPIRVEIHPKGAKGKHMKNAKDERELEWGKIRATVTKDTNETPLGFKVARYNHRKGIYIAHIEEGSQLLETNLKPGMRITKINDIACPDDIGELVSLFKTLTGTLEIQAINVDKEDEVLPLKEPTVISVAGSKVATFFDSIFVEG